MIQCEVCHWTAWAGDVATVVGVAIAAIGGWYAYHGWKREMRRRAKFELAQEILMTVYILQKAVKDFRKPIKPTPDVIEDWKEKYPRFEEDSKHPWLWREPSPEKEIVDLDEKWLPVSKAAAEVEVPQRRAEILLHPEANHILENISKYVGLLYVLSARYKQTLIPAIDLDFEERSAKLATVMWRMWHRLYYEPIIGGLDLYRLIEQLEHELKRYLKD